MSVRKVRDAFVLMVAFLVLLWVIQVFNWADGYRLDAEFGILPHHVSRIPDIFLAPFLHFNWQHIEGNSLPLFVLGLLAAYRGIIRFLLVTLLVAVVSGLAVWLFQSSGDLTVGASGLIFGYFSYVLLRGIFDRNAIDIVVGVIAGVMYWTILSVAIPGTPGISWIGHLGGLVGGILAAWLLRTPAADRAVAWGFGDLGSLDGIRAKLGRGSGSGAGDAGGADSPRGSGGSDRSGASDRSGRTRPQRQSPTTGSTAPGSTVADDLLRQIDDMGL
jgi:membrane associated rhomboid family serine protease